MDNQGDGIEELAVPAQLQAAFADAIDVVDGAVPVPWCAGWRVADPVEHLSAVHHRAVAMARSTDVEPWHGAAHPGLRYAESAAELRPTLPSLDPSAPARNQLEAGTARWRSVTAGSSTRR